MIDEISTSRVTRLARHGLNMLDWRPMPRWHVGRQSVWSTYLNARRDPQHGTYHAPNQYDRLSAWHDTATANGINGVVLHDCLSDHFVEQHSNEYVKFIRVSRRYLKSTNDHRFFLYRALLRDYSYPSVFMTDLFDVRMARDPFSMVESSTLYVGDDASLIGSCEHICEKAQSTGDERYKRFIDEYGDHATLNAGILGGETEIVREFVSAVCEEIKRINNWRMNANMLVFNYVGYTQYSNYVSQKLCSRFKQYEHDRLDVPFIHK